MMSEFKWFQTCVFLALLQFPAAAETKPLSLAVRVGTEVTLSCENVTEDQEDCRGTTWIYSYLEMNAEEMLTLDGKIHREAGVRSDRLSVTANCSLIIQNVNQWDYGRYICRQLNESGHQQGKETRVYLFVETSAAETKTLSQTAGDDVLLPCIKEMKDQEDCRGTAWLYSYFGTNAAKASIEDGHIQSDAGAKSDRLSVTVDCSLLILKVTEEDAGLYTCRQFSESGQQGRDTEVYLTVEKSEDTGPATKPSSQPEPGPPASLTLTVSASNDTPVKHHAVRRDCSVLDIIMLLLRVAELLLITVITVLLIRAGNQRRRDKDMLHHDGDDSRVEYVNDGEPSASIRLH